jgi:hypothetical protein
VPKRPTNHSRTSGCAHSKLAGITVKGREDIVGYSTGEMPSSQIVRPPFYLQFI